MCLQSWLTNQLLRSLVERRRIWLKTASGLKRQQFDIQQQALKLTANR
jgi:DNA polymerase alpha subunit A